MDKSSPGNSSPDTCNVQIDRHRGVGAAESNAAAASNAAVAEPLSSAPVRGDERADRRQTDRQDRQTDKTDRQDRQTDRTDRQDRQTGQTDNEIDSWKREECIHS